MLCIGHRGAAGHAPENTLASFERAIGMGADWIELDVQMCDGQVIVIHDETLERTTNGSGLVSEWSFGDLRGLDAGNGQRIPTLQEVLDLVNGRTGVNIELKGVGTSEPVVSLLRQIVSKPVWSPDRFLLSSFSIGQLRAARERDPAFPIGALFTLRSPIPVIRTALLGATSVHVPLSRATARLVRRAHRRGLRVLVYTVNDREDIERMYTLGVDGVFSDYPDRVADVRAKMQCGP
jgi:glycerophosphoryl diester phosphodiesterase